MIKKLGDIGIFNFRFGPELNSSWSLGMNIGGYMAKLLGTELELEPEPVVPLMLEPAIELFASFL